MFTYQSKLIEVIDGEIAATQALSSKVRLLSTGAAETILGHMAYVNGLRFARDLIVARNKENNTLKETEIRLP